METKESGQKMTISDVAEALNISKTTVSRAISGKGRIGAETRRRVLDAMCSAKTTAASFAEGISKTFKSCSIVSSSPS